MDHDEFAIRLRFPEDALEFGGPDLQVARRGGHVGLERRRLPKSHDRLAGSRRGIQGVVDRAAALEGGRFSVECVGGRDRGHRVRHLRDGRHASDCRGPRAAREILLVREPRFPHVDVEVHRSRQDQRVPVVDRLVRPEGLPDGRDLAVLVDPDAQRFETPAIPNATANDPHAPPPSSGARWAHAVALR